MIAFKERNAGVCPTSDSRPLLHCLPDVVDGPAYILHLKPKADCSIAPRFPRDIRIESDQQRVVDKLLPRFFQLICDLERKVRRAPAGPRVSVVKCNMKRLHIRLLVWLVYSRFWFYNSKLRTNIGAF